jgi:Putative Actinobacterial Holin-X, holin superfamily III
MSTPVETQSGLPGEPQSLGDLIGEVTKDLSTLMRQEVELAKAEVTQSAQRAGRGAGMLGGAGFAVYMVLLFLTIGLWWALGSGTGLGWSAVIVAAIWGVIGTALFVLGRKELRTIRGLSRTSDSLKKIPDALKGNEDSR